MIDDPGGRERAPEPLRLVQAFVNTRDIENGVDELSSPDALAAVLCDLGLLEAPETPLGDSDLRVAIETREALRELALANGGVPLPAEARATLGRAASSAHLTLRVGADGRPKLVPAAGGLDGALGAMLAVVHEAAADGSWPRLKACPRDGCRWVFYDRSRNASGKWCAMSVCGNRVNTKAYRRRSTRSR